MAESVSFARRQVPLEISTGNSTHSWGKWKQKFDIYLRAIGAAKKPDERGSGAAIKTHWRVVFGNLLTLHFLTRA